MTDSPNLKLPYLLAAQAQKHVTHNEALRALDNLVQLSVLDRDASAPPLAPVEGARYLVAASATGAWAGQAGRIAAFQDGAWQFHTPLEGWLAWVADEDVLVVYTGSAWALAATGGGGSASVNPVAMVGVNATADTTNRLSVNSAASLFNHQGSGGHQLKINKAAVTDSASLLYQTGFSGRAEIGTTGDDNFHFKVSSNGTSWTDAITVRPTGNVGIGTTNANAKLEVNGDVTVSGVVQTNVEGGGLVVDAAGYQRFGFIKEPGYNPEFRYASSVGFITRRVTGGSIGAPSSSDIAMACAASGYVGIGLSNPSHQLHVATDSAAKPGTNTWTISSDARLKDNIVVADLARCWQIVKGIPLKRYTWKDDAYTPEQIGDRSQLGWIAQDVQPFFKNAVAAHTFARPPLQDGTVETIDDCLTLNADQIYAAMYGALQHAMARIEALEGGLARLASQPSQAAF